MKHSFNKSSWSVYYERMLPRDFGPGWAEQRAPAMQLDPEANTFNIFAPGQKSSMRKCPRISKSLFINFSLLKIKG